MAKTEEESIADILHELDKNKLAKSVIDKLSEQAKHNTKINAAVVCGVLITILALNWMNKLSIETNGWIIASIIGYLFGRNLQK